MESNGVVNTEFLTGPAGTGKTFEILRRIEENPGSAILCATTGIAAINMNTVTINSVLGYYNTADLGEKYARGVLEHKLRMLASKKRPRQLTIDEVSMHPSAQLDMIYQAVQSVNAGDNEHEPLEHPLGITLTGDFCQLPPVSTKADPAKWAFKADCWPSFAANTTKLTKIWRQTDPAFLQAINHARAGNGLEASNGFRAMGAEFAGTRDMNFDGTTIIANNDEVDAYNDKRLAQIKEPSFALDARRWGIQDRAWRSIPNRACFRPTCLVMILTNKKYSVYEQSHSSPYAYVNGDLAHVEYFDPEAEIVGTSRINIDGDFVPAIRIAPAVLVTVNRTGEQHLIEPITRLHTLKGGPDDEERILKQVQRMAIKDPPVPQVGEYAPYWDEEKERWIIGSITYYPLRLAYCTTVHKSQGLTLDRVQIDIQAPFFGAPGMAYVALSRVRSKEGLRIVGNPMLLANRIKLNPEVKEYL